MTSRVRVFTDADRSIARHIVALPIARGMTSVELASAIGVSRQKLQNYETEKSELSACKARDIAKALGVDVYELIDGGKDRTDFGYLNIPDVRNMLKERDAIELLRLYADLEPDAQHLVRSMIEAAARL